jgi:hypothetical protein
VESFGAGGATGDDTRDNDAARDVARDIAEESVNRRGSSSDKEPDAAR